MADYERVAEDIENQIRTGRLRPGDPLPSIAQLAAHHGVSQTTVKMAQVSLRSRGLIRGHQGKAVYVADPDDPPAPG